MEPTEKGVYIRKGNTLDKLVCFDLDGTLVSSKGKFFRNALDYHFLSNRIATLKLLVEQDNSIAILTNQKYKGQKLKTAIQRIDNIVDELLNCGIDPWVIAATEDNEYRKPNIGMYTMIKSYFDCDTYYVGDAAGRSGDFSDSDKKFAINSDIPFAVPEEYF